jgi:hypothetical protein
MATAARIRDRVAAFLVDQISLDELNVWLTVNTWNIHHDRDSESEGLTYALELRLAEHSIGHLTDAQLRDELRSFVSSYATRIRQAPELEYATSSTGSSVLRELAAA